MVRPLEAAPRTRGRARCISTGSSRLGSICAHRGGGRSRRARRRGAARRAPRRRGRSASHDDTPSFSQALEAAVDLGGGEAADLAQQRQRRRAVDARQQVALRGRELRAATGRSPARACGIRVSADVAPSLPAGACLSPAPIPGTRTGSSAPRAGKLSGREGSRAIARSAAPRGASRSAALPGAARGAVRGPADSAGRGAGRVEQRARGSPSGRAAGSRPGRRRGCAGRRARRR